MQFRELNQAVASLVFFLISAAANASSFAVSPLRVSLSADQPTTSLVVRNSSSHPTVLQLEVMQWSQYGGNEILEPSNDVLATPPIVTIPAGGSQVLRLGMRKPPDPDRELTYRLFLREVPRPPGEAAEGVRWALNISLPVFILPDVDVAPVLQWTATRSGEGNIRLAVNNSGNAHVQVANFKLSFAGGIGQQGKQSVSDYVLSGQNREWLVSASPPVGGVVQVTAETDMGEVQAEFRVTESNAEQRFTEVPEQLQGNSQLNDLKAIAQDQHTGQEE